MEDGAALVVVQRTVCQVVVRRVRQVVEPDVLVVINVQHQQSRCRQRGIPPCALAVLQQVVFVAVALVCHLVELVGIRQRLHFRHRLRRRQLLGCNPSYAHALETRVVAWLESFGVVATLVHQRPVTHAVESRVARVVHIHQTQTVGELVADGANARQLIAAVAQLVFNIVYLVGASIRVHI